MNVSRWWSNFLDLLVWVGMIFAAIFVPVIVGYSLIGSDGGLIGLIFGIVILLAVTATARFPSEVNDQ